jgi:4-carboxymuconolactone decarboxylase
MRAASTLVSMPVARQSNHIRPFVLIAPPLDATSHDQPTTNPDTDIMLRAKETVLDKQTFEKGLALRRDMFGAELADKAWASADDFNRPLEELVNQYCFGEIWSRPGLDRKTRSIATLSMLTGANKPNQIRAHVRGAINNGVSKDEIQELFLQAAIYCGVPAAVDSFRIAREVFQEMGI